MEKITYKYLGDRDLKDAKIMLEHGGSPSAVGRLVQQAIEKNLKQCIENARDTQNIYILSTHNTIKLYDKVVELKGIIYDREDRKMMSVIKDYYFDLNYPGEDTMELEYEEAKEAVTFAEYFIKKIKF